VYHFLSESEFTEFENFQNNTKSSKNTAVPSSGFGTLSVAREKLDFELNGGYG